MRIGIDFDNTIICYDQVFCDLAKSWQWISPDFQGSKQQLRDLIQVPHYGDVGWQRLQGKIYGEFIEEATLFPGFKEFITVGNAISNLDIFIVSHKTEFGHFDEKRVNLRDASHHWLQKQGFFDLNSFHIKKSHVFFESTREKKIERIKTLQCTHFIDDLIEVLDAPSFPREIERILFQPFTCTMTTERNTSKQKPLKTFSNWTDIKYALFTT